MQRNILHHQQILERHAELLEQTRIPSSVPIVLMRLQNCFIDRKPLISNLLCTNTLRMQVTPVAFKVVVNLMAVVKHVFERSALILVFYLVLGDPLNPSFALWLDKGTDCCLALAAGSVLKTFSPPKLSMKRKVADKRHPTLEQISSAASLRVIKLTRDILLAGLLLQCNDISLNPGPNVKGAVSRNSAKLRNYKMPVELRET